MRRTGEQHQGLHLAPFLQTLHDLKGQRPVALLVHVQVMGFVDEHEIPGLGIEQALPTIAPVETQRMCRGDYPILGIPEIGSFRIDGGNVDRDSDVEHFPQPHLPLFDQAGGRQDEQSAHALRRQQRGEDEARFDGLAKPHVVRHQPSRGPRFEHPLANPELMRQQGDAGPGKDAPGVVDRTNALAEDPCDDMQRGIGSSGGHPLGQTLDGFEVGGQTLLYPMLEADDDAVALIDRDSAETEAVMPDCRVPAEGCHHCSRPKRRHKSSFEATCRSGMSNAR